jgi:ComF family protein
MRQLLPPLCWKCGIVLGGKTYLDPASPFLCSDCLIGLPWTDPVYHCRQCGNLTAEPDRLRCEECLEDIWDLDESRSGFAYNDTIRHWILQLKFFGKQHLSPLLGRLLALSFQNSTWLEKYDFLVPIPLHSTRLRSRGFNQSLLLAHHFRKNLGNISPEIHLHWLRRTRATRPQTELPLEERLINLDNAFSALPEVRNRNILLFDDVMTTGSTLNAAARCIKEAGASSVGALVLGRKMWDSFE